MRKTRLLSKPIQDTRWVSINTSRPSEIGRDVVECLCFTTRGITLIAKYYSSEDVFITKKGTKLNAKNSIIAYIVIPDYDDLLPVTA